MNILIADDHLLNRKLLRTILEVDGHRVIEATDGTEALALLSTEPVDAIISDILMPKMDGYQFCCEVRRTPRWRRIPFIVYTAAYLSPADEKLSYELGAAGFLRKPASAAEIAASLATAMRATPPMVPQLTLSADGVVLKEYSQRLVDKLEEKNVDLAASVDSLLRAEKQLRLQSAALESAANAILITDAKGIILWTNPAFTTISGYAASDAIGCTPRLLKSGLHDDAFYADLWRTIRSGKTWRGEFANRRKDGSLYYDEETITPVRGADGVITHYVGVMNDVTARKRTEEELRATHAQLRQLLEHSPAVIYSLQLEDERIVPSLVSESVTRLLGFTVAQATSYQWWFGQLHPEDRDRAVASIGETLERGTTRTEYRLRHRNGTDCWVEDNRRLIRDSAGQPLELVGVWTDITGRKRVEDALLESERRFRELLENVDLIAMTVDKSGTVTFCNDYLLKLTGWQRNEVVGASFFATFIPAEDTETTTLFAETVAAGTIPSHRENSIKTRNGEIRNIAWNNTMLRDAGGSVVGTASIGEDVTDRNRAEATLRSSEERFRQVVENIHEVFWMLDAESHQILYISPGYEAIWGRTCESLYAASHSWMESIHAEDRDRVHQAATTRLLVGDYDETFRIVRPDGTERWVHDRAFPIRDQAGRVFRVVGTAEDISTRKQAELQLKLQHAVTSVLAEAASPTEIHLKILETLCRGLQWDLGELWMADRVAKVLRCAEIWHPPSTEFKELAAASRQLVFAMGEDLLGRVWASGQSEWTLDVARDVRSQRRTQTARLGLRGWIGFPIKIRKEVLGVVGFFSTHMQPPDVETLAVLGAIGAQIGQFMERQQLASQFRQAQKMEAIGTLAGGIAHDFNNVLAAINGYTELARNEVAGNAVAVEYLDAVLHGANRATDLVRQILAFSRQQEPERKAIQLRKAVAETIKLLRATIPATIEFDVVLATDAPSVLADASQIHQVVMNLCTNAAHAMKECSGRLTVRLDSLDVDGDLAAKHPGLQSGRHVRLSVSDTGCGMDEATLSRIFEPFFTTKAPGEGTGLGLAVVHGIMRSHEGVVTVHSHPGDGTTFRLYFPAHVSAAVEAMTEAEAVPRGRGERILYVDDEAPLATIGKIVLERLGYSVDIHTNAREALAAVRSEPRAFDLVITDQMMPGLTGTGLADLLHAIRADLPIILATGHMGSLTVDGAEAIGIRRLVLKPLSATALGLLVGSVLAEAKTEVTHATNPARR